MQSRTFHIHEIKNIVLFFLESLVENLKERTEMDERTRIIIKSSKIFVAGFTRFTSNLETFMHSIVDILTSRYTVLINDFDRDNFLSSFSSLLTKSSRSVFLK